MTFNNANGWELRPPWTKGPTRIEDSTHSFSAVVPPDWFAYPAEDRALLTLYNYNTFEEDASSIDRMIVGLELQTLQSEQEFDGFVSMWAKSWRKHSRSWSKGATPIEPTVIGKWHGQGFGLLADLAELSLFAVQISPGRVLCVSMNFTGQADASSLSRILDSVELS